MTFGWLMTNWYKSLSGVITGSTEGVERGRGRQEEVRGGREGGEGWGGRGGDE